MGFLVVPFAFLPLELGFWVWRAFCIAVAILLLRAARLERKVILLGVASPAATHDFTHVQNGTLTGALFLSALLMIKTNPRLAGISAGILTIKPILAFQFSLHLSGRAHGGPQHMLPASQSP